MRYRVLIAVTAAISPLVFVPPVLAQARSAPVHDCDRLAASDLDANAVAPGIPWNRLDGPAAEVACAYAVDSYRDVARFHFQLGRALHVQRKMGQAADQYDEALKLQPGYLTAVHNRGNIDAEKQYYTTAVELYRRAAAAGFAPSQFAMGVAYQSGRGVDQDYAEAVGWYRKAAAQRNAAALHALGTMYENGWGVRPDLAEALRLYKNAAARGYEAARRDAARLDARGAVAAAKPSQPAAAPVIEQLRAVAEPRRVRPGETVELQLSYSVSGTEGATVQESRTLTFGGGIVPSYPVKVERMRSAGAHESVYPQKIPSGAAPGIYEYRGEACLVDRCYGQTATFEVVR